MWASAPTVQYFYKIVEVYKIVEDDAHIVLKTAQFYLQGNNGVPRNVNFKQHYSNYNFLSHPFKATGQYIFVLPRSVI